MNNKGFLILATTRGEYERAVILAASLRANKSFTNTTADAPKDNASEAGISLLCCGRFLHQIEREVFDEVIVLEGNYTNTNEGIFQACKVVECDETIIISADHFCVSNPDEIFNQPERVNFAFAKPANSPLNTSLLFIRKGAKSKLLFELAEYIYKHEQRKTIAGALEAAAQELKEVNLIKGAFVILGEYDRLLISKVAQVASFFQFPIAAALPNGATTKTMNAGILPRLLKDYENTTGKTIPRYLFRKEIITAQTESLLAKTEIRKTRTKSLKKKVGDAIS